MAKKSFPTPTAPRALEDIKNEFQQLQFALGQQDYLANMHAEKAAELRKRMKAVDDEAGERQELDKKVAAEVKNENPES